MSVARPIVNAGEQYINGLQLGWSSSTLLNVYNGICRDSTNVNDISLNNLNSSGAAIPTVINSAVQGAGGIDVGLKASLDSALIAVYAIGSSLDQSMGSALVSLSFTQPALPNNYDMFRRIGAVLCDSSGNFLQFVQGGSVNDSNRPMWYDTALATSVTAGASATYASCTLNTTTNCIPVVSNLYGTTIYPDAILNVVFTPTGASNTLNLKSYQSASAAGQVIISGDVAAVAHNATVVVPTYVDGSAHLAIQYKVTGSAVAIDVQGYIDCL